MSDELATTTPADVLEPVMSPEKVRIAVEAELVPRVGPAVAAFMLPQLDIPTDPDELDLQLYEYACLLISLRSDTAPGLTITKT